MSAAEVRDVREVREVREVHVELLVGRRVVDADGRPLGAHDGHWTFTPGQRKGIGVSAPRPLYVLDTDPRTNTVVVGEREALARTRVTARGTLYADVARADAKLRYRSDAIAADVARTPRGFALHLDEPAYGVARGQAAVLYEGDAVVGCGLI
jgi:tRNA-specific 2-thiouridylase